MNAPLTTTPDLFRAFADPTRLRILNLLLEDELCVCELCHALGEIHVAARSMRKTPTKEIFAFNRHLPLG